MGADWRSVGTGQSQ